MLSERVTPILTSAVAWHLGPGLAILAILFKDSPHGVLSLPFLQEAEGSGGRGGGIEGASILTSGEFWAPHSFEYKESTTMPGTFLDGKMEFLV